MGLASDRLDAYRLNAEDQSVPLLQAQWRGLELARPGHLGCGDETFCMHYTSAGEAVSAFWTDLNRPQPTDEAHKAWLQEVVQMQLWSLRRPDVDHKMKWAVREANRRYVEQTLQEDETGDVFQVDWYSNWLNQQQWKACPIHVVWKTYYY